MVELLNFAAVAGLNNNIIIIMFDDYLAVTSFSRSIGWAWENTCRWGYVRELMRCSYAKRQFYRGFVVYAQYSSTTPSFIETTARCRS